MRNLMSELFSNVVQSSDFQGTKWNKLKREIEKEMEHWERALPRKEYDRLCKLMEYISMRDSERQEELFRSGLTFGLLLMSEAYAHEQKIENTMYD